MRLSLVFVDSKGNIAALNGGDDPKIVLMLKLESRAEARHSQTLGCMEVLIAENGCLNTAGEIVRSYGLCTWGTHG